jgi:hypothetical protein
MQAPCAAIQRVNAIQSPWRTSTPMSRNAAAYAGCGSALADQNLTTALASSNAWMNAIMVVEPASRSGSGTR